MFNVSGSLVQQNIHFIIVLVIKTLAVPRSGSELTL